MLKLPYENSKAWLQKRVAALQETRSDKEDGDHEHDEHHYARLGWYVVIFGFCGFILWASFAPLDKGVASEGTVIADGQRKTIQAPFNGTIDEILVRDGDTVRAGQVLIQYNDLQVTAQANAAQQAVIGLKAQVSGLEDSIRNKQGQLTAMKEQLVNVQLLTKEGYVARNRMLEAERSYLQLKGSLAEDQGNLSRYRTQLAEQESRLAAYEFDLANASVKSPVNGSVLNLEVFTKGAVTQMGAKLLEVEPENAPLIVEARVPVHLIDKVYIDLPVELLFTGFNTRTTPNIPGKVIVVSNNRTLDPRTGEPFYKIQVEVTPAGKLKLRDNKVRPGMSAQVFIVTGERTMMSYLFKPITDRLHTALNEE
jgi:membrane fusion protein, protease secretion system